MKNLNISFSKYINKSKKQDFIDSIIFLTESSSSSKENTSIDLKDLMNTSEMIYTLSIIYLFGDSQIYANTEMSRLQLSHISCEYNQELRDD